MSKTRAEDEAKALRKLAESSVKHGGPGSHPSGSSQSVHGGGVYGEDRRRHYSLGGFGSDFGEIGSLTDILNPLSGSLTARTLDVWGLWSYSHPEDGKDSPEAKVIAAMKPSEAVAAMKEYFRKVPGDWMTSIGRQLERYCESVSYGEDSIEVKGATLAVINDIDEAMKDAGWDRENMRRTYLSLTTTTFRHPSGYTAEWEPTKRGDWTDFVLKFIAPPSS